MALSIKNAEAERLVKELAREQGTTVTASVIDALEQAPQTVSRAPLATASPAPDNGSAAR